MRSHTHFRARCLSLAFWWILPWIAGSAMAARSEAGYIYEGKEPIRVKVTLIVRGEKAPYKGVEAISWEIEVKPGTKFESATSFLPVTRSQYERLSEERAKTGVRFPRFEILLSGCVLRGVERTVVAESRRRISWPKDFQLKDGDVVQIYEVNDP